MGRERGREPESLKELLCVREWERSAEDRSGFLETVLEESSRWSSRPNTSSRGRSLGGDFLAFALRLMDARGTTSRQPWSKIAVCTSYRPDHEGFLHTYSCVRNASMLSSE